MSFIIPSLNTAAALEALEYAGEYAKNLTQAGSETAKSVLAEYGDTILSAVAVVGLGFYAYKCRETHLAQQAERKSQAIARQTEAQVEPEQKATSESVESKDELKIVLEGDEASTEEFSDRENSVHGSDGDEGYVSGSDNDSDNNSDNNSGSKLRRSPRLANR
jgi:hypothetical protein